MYILISPKVLITMVNNPHSKKKKKKLPDGIKSDGQNIQHIIGTASCIT